MRVLFYNMMKFLEAMMNTKVKTFIQSYNNLLTVNNSCRYHSAHQDKTDDPQDPSNELLWRWQGCCREGNGNTEKGGMETIVWTVYTQRIISINLDPKPISTTVIFLSECISAFSLNTMLYKLLVKDYNLQQCLNKISPQLSY